MELVKAVISNLHSVITSRVTIMDSISKFINKYMHKILLPFENILQCIGVYWVANIWDVLIVYGNKVLNIITFIVE